MPDPTLVSFDLLLNKISDLTEGLTAEVSAELQAGAQDIANIAKRNAPADQGFLRNLISSRQLSTLEYQVVSASAYSPYVEFGTGEHVQIPPGLEEYAAQFKGDFSSGTYSAGVAELSFKEAIFAWCQRKGIDENLWYAIYISIGIHGIHAQPFFFPAVEEMRPQIIKRIQAVIDDHLKS